MQRTNGNSQHIVGMDRFSSENQVRMVNSCLSKMIQKMELKQRNKGKVQKEKCVC